MFCKFTRLAYEYIYVTLYCASSLESDPLSAFKLFFVYLFKYVDVYLRSSTTYLHIQCDKQS